MPIACHSYCAQVGALVPVYRLDRQDVTIQYRSVFCKALLLNALWSDVTQISIVRKWDGFAAPWPDARSALREDRGGQMMA